MLAAKKENEAPGPTKQPIRGRDMVRVQHVARNIGNVSLLLLVVEAVIKVGEKLGFGIYGTVYKV